MEVACSKDSSGEEVDLATDASKSGTVRVTLLIAGNIVCAYCFTFKLKY